MPSVDLLSRTQVLKHGFQEVSAHLLLKCHLIGGQYGFSAGQFSSFYWANLVYPDEIEAVRFHLLQFLL